MALAHALGEAGIDYPRVVGGYKAMRTFLIDTTEQAMAQCRFVVLGGYTGIGKTEVLAQLPSALDLEGHANHRGSSFGRHATPQPGQIDFDNRLAIDILTSTTVRDAFDLSREPENLRDRYGANFFGQACLMARRLVEAGTRFVEIKWYDGPAWDAWDVHGADLGGMVRMQQHLCPRLDQALSALIEDIFERCLDQQIAVVAMGEFGRTPRISHAEGLQGRDHWPQSMSALVSGGGWSSAAPPRSTRIGHVTSSSSSPPVTGFTGSSLGAGLPAPARGPTRDGRSISPASSTGCRPWPLCRGPTA